MRRSIGPRQRPWCCALADEADEITTPPPAPTGLVVIPASPGRDTTPQVTGTALPSRPVAVYDTFGGATTKLTETTTNAAGIFYADLTVPLVDGTHVFTAKVKNALGVVSPASAPVNYVLDTVAPTGSITAPSVPFGQLDAAVDSDKPVFTATAADERSGVDSVAFEYATAAAPTTWIPVSTDEDGAPYAAVWGAASLADGQYLFRADHHRRGRQHRHPGERAGHRGHHSAHRADRTWIAGTSGR